MAKLGAGQTTEVETNFCQYAKVLLVGCQDSSLPLARSYSTTPTLNYLQRLVAFLCLQNALCKKEAFIFQLGLPAKASLQVKNAFSTGNGTGSPK